MLIVRKGAYSPYTATTLTLDIDTAAAAGYWEFSPNTPNTQTAFLITLTVAKPGGEMFWA